MEGLEKSIEFIYKKQFTNEFLYSVKSKIIQLPGITGISNHDKAMTLRYNPYKVSEDYLEKEMRKLGFRPASEVRKKSKVARWLDKMAKANKKNLGSQPLDCCELKSKQN